MKIYTTDEIEAYVLDFLKVCRNFDPYFYSIFNTQYITGARFSDVYNLENWSIINDNTISLQPKKQNNLRIFDIDDMDDLLIQQVKSGYNGYELTSYSSALFWFKRIFPNPNLRVLNKPVKTHIFRHLKAKKLKEEGKTDKEIQQYLGEKKEISARAYIYSSIYE